ncbi:MAG: tetratricopeptide repeat protein [Candidatus Devosia symbiotica]|nr:tetratricopeptide repeat protein [Candidatus Devosia symbiotica]
MAEDNIFREVDEELCSDRMRALWRRFAPYVIGAAVAVVAVVALNEAWTWYHASKAAVSSDELYVAFDLVDGGDLAAAQTQLDMLIADGSGSYPTLAEFRKAGVLAKDSKIDEAVAAYDALVNTQSNQRLRELALVLGGFLMIDNGTLADVDSRVGSVATDASPLRNAAREALGLAQYKAGDLTAAQASFEAVLNDVTQTTTRNRMGYYLAQLQSQGVVAPAADAATTTETPATDASATTTEAAPVVQ